MTYCDDVDEGDSTYATTTASEDIHYIETTNEWSQCMSTSNRASRHVWTKEEEGTLVECLMELVPMRDGNRIMVRFGQVTLHTWPLPKCRGQHAVALSGTMNRNESLQRKHYLIIGLAKGLLNKPFSYYDELTYVFGRDRVMGQFAETFADVGSNEPGGASDGRTGSRGSQREVDVEGIHLALDQTNEQLRMIAEWPARALANDNHVHTKFFCILRKMPELTSFDRALLQRHLLSCMDDLRGFVLMPEDEREGFCGVLLRDITR
ncbi:retrotransposon protein [Cucumis melo var. makuwa]|uniref:Retrotransposon protein n=2 Tax=Cucumis melo TaxID=3656 RepID=A0A5D3BYQ3_CUCMM|nr:retrotransposon protein [Cucumis melo var. makuwa]